MYSAGVMENNANLLTIAGIVLTVILALVALGVSFVTASSPEIGLAKWCFHAAAVVLLISAVAWLANIQSRLAIRVILSVLIFSAIGIAWVEVIKWVDGRKPNIVCLGDCDLWVEVRRNTICETESGNFLDFPRLVGVKYCNEAIPPKKVGNISNVGAHIIFYDYDWPNEVEHRVDSCYWLDERSPRVTFDPGTVHCLVIGTFQPKRDGNGFERGLTVYENTPNGTDASVNLYRESTRFRVIVKLVVGRHGEFGLEDEFELKFDESSFEFYRLSNEIKQAQREEMASNLMRFTDEGWNLIVKPIDISSQQFYQDAHKWRNTVVGFLDERGGKHLSMRFIDLSNTKQHPYNRGHVFLDDLYTQILNLKVIASEYNPQPPTSSLFSRLGVKLGKTIRFRKTARNG
jgi:hypothetical protein